MRRPTESSLLPKCWSLRLTLITQMKLAEGRCSSLCVGPIQHFQRGRDLTCLDRWYVVTRNPSRATFDEMSWRFTGTISKWTRSDSCRGGDHPGITRACRRRWQCNWCEYFTQGYKFVMNVIVIARSGNGDWFRSDPCHSEAWPNSHFQEETRRTDAGGAGTRRRNWPPVFIIVHWRPGASQ